MSAATAREWPRLGLAAFRSRIVFHGTFLLLALATLVFAVNLLVAEKQRAYQRYEQGFTRSLAEISARLRHPTGQLALLNPGHGAQPAALRPLLLPLSAIDFDDPQKTERAAEVSGCGLRYPDGASLCVAVGSNALAGGFIYVVGSLDAGPLTGRERGALDLTALHRARITLTLRGETLRWIAPFEAMEPADMVQRGRLTGFTVAPEGAEQLAPTARPQREFRGWLWREGPCRGRSAPSGAAANEDNCPRHTLYSLRLPVEAWRADVLQKPAPLWPPVDLDQVRLRVELLAPGGILFDSAAAEPLPATSLTGLGDSLQPGETLTISRVSDSREPRVVARLRGHDDSEAIPSPWLTRLIQRLPVEFQGAAPTLRATDTVHTPLGRYELVLAGDLRSLDRSLSVSASRASWLVGAMLAAITLAWALIELGLVRRIARLTRRAAAVSHQMQQPDARLGELDVADLRGKDELGILAGTLAELLQHTREAARREQLRAEHERDIWHAVGHEIVSPLQALLALHDTPDDASRRYLLRMQQAVRVLYGAASPSEALASATLPRERLDFASFARHVADNAAYAGIENVVLAPFEAKELLVRADEHALEDAVTHVLRNAERYRPPGTPITLSLHTDSGMARLRIHNLGPPIGDAMLATMFDYGVSDQQGEADAQRRGQGLFVAKTYLAKMDGTISARNTTDGVVLELALPLQA